MITIIWTWSAFQYVSVHVDMPTCADMWRVPTCADMCRHVPTCDITLGTSDTNHLDLTSKLACVSTCGHADMCQHVSSLSAYLIRTLWILSACWHVSAHVDMPTCANMYHHSRHIWYEPFGPYLHAGMHQHIWTCRHVLICADMCRHVLICADMCQHVASLSAPLLPTILTFYLHAGMCQHIWTCRHVLICTDMCQHVASLSAPLIPTIWTLPPSWHVSAHMDMPTCADMCRHVVSLSAPLIPTIWTLPRCWHVSAHVDIPICADMCRHVLTCDITLSTYDTNHLDKICNPACVSTCGHADMC